MIKTLRIFFSLRSAYKVNSILFSLKQIPLVKKLLPASLYSVRELKIFANVIAAIWELISAFLAKFLYFLLPIYLMLAAYDGISKDSLFLHILLCMSMIGALMNTFLFNPTKDKHYAVILMRMNARECALVDYGYAMLKLLIGFLIFGTLFGTMAGVPLWVCILIPFFVAGLKMTVAAHDLIDYEKTGNAKHENNQPKVVWVITAALLAAAYGLPVVGIVLPWWVTVILMMIPIFTVLLSLRKILTFLYYREYYQQILKPVINQKALAREMTRASTNKLISADVSITSKRSGFEYLNELFIKRHHRLLWKASKRIALVCTGLIAASLVGFYVYPDLMTIINKFLMTSLPWFVFIMYSLNRGTGFTRVLFMNCDHSLLTYSFYKQPKFMLRLFRIRLREIIKVNLLPACVLGPGLALLLYASGGTDDPLNYAVLALSIPATSVFFSVHYLMIYYLLQPYNAGTEIKSATYQIVMVATYAVCFGIMRLNLPTLMFGAMTIVFCVLYSIVACVLVYRIAPKTFRLRA